MCVLSLSAVDVYVSAVCPLRWQDMRLSFNHPNYAYQYKMRVLNALQASILIWLDWVSGDHLESKLLSQIDKSFLAVFLILSIFWLHVFSFYVHKGEQVVWLLNSSMSDYFHGIFHALSCHIEIAYGLSVQNVAVTSVSSATPPSEVSGLRLRQLWVQSSSFWSFISLLFCILPFYSLICCCLSAVELWMVSFIINVNDLGDIKGEFCWPIKYLIG